MVTVRIHIGRPGLVKKEMFAVPATVEAKKGDTLFWDRDPQNPIVGGTMFIHFRDGRSPGNLMQLKEGQTLVAENGGLFTYDISLAGGPRGELEVSVGGGGVDVGPKD